MELNDISHGFSALSQPSRLEILRMLVKAGTTGIAAGEIAREINVPGPTASFHLKELERSGLIHSRKDGRRIIYAPDYGGLRELIDFFLTDCCQGERRLCGPYVVREPA